MTVYVNNHRVEFFHGGRIAVDGRIIALAIKATNGGHYTYMAEGQYDEPTLALVKLSGRKLTGPGKPVGSYEADLAAEIVEALS